MSEDWTWILWTVLGVVLVIAEVFTPGFVLLWFGVGALAAALAAFLGAGLAAQFILFIVVSSALTALSRTIFSKPATASSSSASRVPPSTSAAPARPPTGAPTSCPKAKQGSDSVSCLSSARQTHLTYQRGN